MKSSNHAYLMLVRALVFVTLLGSLGAAPPTSEAEPAAPLDEPVAVALDRLTTWTLDSGLLYWALRCAPEFPEPGYLRRQPSNGGTRRTLSTVGAADCDSFAGLAADSDGVYYYGDDAGNGIYHRPVADPYDPATLVLSTSAAPNGELVIYDDYIYWVTGTGGEESQRLRRIRKDGTGLQTVADSLDGPDALLVRGSTVYWLDDDGLWRTSLSCGSLPCAKERLVSTAGTRLLDRTVSSSVYEILWVERIFTGGTSDSIRRLRCELAGADWECTASTAYTPRTTSWRISGLAMSSTHLFWTEHRTYPSEGKILRMPLRGGTDDAVEILSGAPNLGPNLGTDEAYVYFYDHGVSGSDYGIYRLPFDASAIVRDLAADELEVTQVIQNLANDVVLVANKPTYVRGYGRQEEGVQAVGVGAELRATRGGTPLSGSPLRPINGTLALQTGGSYDRAVLDDGWLFRLPDNWTDPGAIALTLVVDPAGEYPDTDAANNQMRESFTFTSKAPVCPVFVPVRTHSPNYGSPTDNPNFYPMVDLFTRLWPIPETWPYEMDEEIAEVETCWWGIIPYPCSGPYELPDDTSKVLTRLRTRELFTDDPDECDDIHAGTYYVGVVHPDTPTTTSTVTVGGAGRYDAYVSWVKFPAHTPTSPSPSSPMAIFNWPRSGEVMAEELGHNRDRHHVDCGSPADPSPYPYPTSQIDNTGAANHYGFDTGTLTPIEPDDAADFMSYCHPSWVSDFTYEAIFNRISALQAEGVTSAVDLTAARSAVVVNGVVTATTNLGELEYAWVYPTAELSEGLLRKWQTAAGEVMASAQLAPEGYYVQAVDAAGSLLTGVRVYPGDVADRPAGSSEQVFSATFSAPAGKVARLELVHGSRLLDQLEPHPGVPVVTILRPAGGEEIGDEMLVSWQATDPDPADNLLHTVQYSLDNGATWLALLTDFPGPRNSSAVSVDLKDLDIPGSSLKSALIRVLSSDGYNTGLATSVAFTVADRRPKPTILSPISGETVPANEPLHLRGAAMDAEDGNLEDKALTWTVDGQSSGMGQEVMIWGLPPGDHAVRLTARDFSGQEAVTEASVTVAPLSIPSSSAPVLDGFCDDAAYKNGVEVLLTAYTDHSQASVFLVRRSSNLWACFSGLRKATSPDEYAMLLVDGDHSQDSLAQPGDHRFVVAEDGGFYARSGNGSGGFAEPGPEGFEAQVSATDQTWRAELRIDTSDWSKVIGFALEHVWFDGSLRKEQKWPARFGGNEPNSWATTALAPLPGLVSLAPEAAVVGDADLTLTVEGVNFTSGATVMWDKISLPTTYVSPIRLTASVRAAPLSQAGDVKVTVRNPDTGSIKSNSLTFMVNNPVPKIGSLTPASTQAGGGAFSISVNGSNFVNGATVLWNGEACPTSFVSASLLRAQVQASQIADARTAGVVVRNPDPTRGVSKVVPFTVDPWPALWLPYVVASAPPLGNGN